MREEAPNTSLMIVLKKLDSDKIGFLGDVEIFTAECRITQSQLRNLYDIIVSIEPSEKEESRKKLVKARIMLEYAMKRNQIPSHFYSPVKCLIEDLLKSSDSKRLDDFRQLMEAIVAYSKKG